MPKTFAGWKGPTPAFAVCRMLEFHSGKQTAKGAWERTTEIDEIIKAAIEDALSTVKKTDKASKPD